MARIFHRFCRQLAVWTFTFVALTAIAAPPASGPVTFEFTVAATDVRNPFARELWARVIRPSGQAIVLPAYYAGEGVYAVRARPDETGIYRLDGVAETTRGAGSTPVPFHPRGAREITNGTRIRLPSIRRDSGNSAAFLRTDGRPYLPVGANVAWPEGECVPYYHQALTAFAKADLNWMRVWMVHWGQLNLDWVPERQGVSPKPGGIDPLVAANWDRLVETAGDQGVYLQIVFQHHGQFTTGANSNWADNPWNAARPGGFLRTPTEFFTSPDARLLTMLKYRYIVARWGWSPAVFAWEFFNEVHWVDAIDKEKNETAVARWHDEMARFVRSVDAYGHLLTTSARHADSPSAAAMDFYQPHLYAADPIAAVRMPLALRPDSIDRPVFYGEVGDDHLALAPAAKAAGLSLLPPVWASIMGRGFLPAQPWQGGELLAANRLAELGAVHRFLAENDFAKRARIGLRPFSASVESDARVPLMITGTQVWQRQPAPDMEIPSDGRVTLAMATIPRIVVGWPGSIADGFPDRMTFRLDLPKDTTLRARIAGAGNGNAALQFLLDDRLAAEKSWPAGPRDTWPQFVEFSVPAGRHTLVVRNPGNADWVDVADIDLGLDTSVLAAVGQRNDTFIALWLWHRANLHALEPLNPASGTVIIEDVPAGRWQVAWWNTLKGTAAPGTAIDHPGGTLRLPTPPVHRHTAVVLTR